MLDACASESPRKMYGGAVNPRTHQQLFPGMALGNELGWSSGEPEIALQHFRYAVFKDPIWNYELFDCDAPFFSAEPDRTTHDKRNAFPLFSPGGDRDGRSIETSMGGER